MKQERLRELIRAEFQRWGRLGGKTRANNLTKGQRQESARKAAVARWSRAKKIKTTKKGW